jgi:N-methylhydantoinase A
VVSDRSRLRSQGDVLALIDQFHHRYGERFGEGSQSPEAGVRINTIRVCSYVEQPKVRFAPLQVASNPLPPPAPRGHRDCHFVGRDGALRTPCYGDEALAEGTRIEGPAIVTTRATTYLVEPGWAFHAAAQCGVWFIRD